MTTVRKPKFSRILLKLSWESLGNGNGTGNQKTASGAY